MTDEERAIEKLEEGTGDVEDEATGTSQRGPVAPDDARSAENAGNDGVEDDPPETLANGNTPHDGSCQGSDAVGGEEVEEEEEEELPKLHHADYKRYGVTLPELPDHPNLPIRDGKVVDYISHRLGVRVAFAADLEVETCEDPRFAKVLRDHNPFLVLRDPDIVISHDPSSKKSSRVSFAFQGRSFSSADSTVPESASRVVSLSMTKFRRRETHVATLHYLCREYLHRVLEVPDLVDIAGETDAQNIRVLDKCTTPYLLMGLPCFAFTFKTKSSASHPTGVFCLLGTYHPGREMALTALVEPETSLGTYGMPDFLAKLFGESPKVSVELFLEDPAVAEVAKAPVDHTSILRQQPGKAIRAERGVIRYCSSTAAVMFELPAYAMQIHEGVSLTSPHSSSMTSITFNLKIQQAVPSWLSEADRDELENKAVHISIGVDVEDLVKSRMGSIMSTIEYGERRIKGIMAQYLNSQPNGAPVTSSIGGRNAVSFLWTGNASRDTRTSSLQKAMCTVSLWGIRGVVVSYFTRTGQGIFDLYLYLMQDLLEGFRFITEREADGGFHPSKATVASFTSAESFEQAFKSRGDMVPRYSFLASKSTEGVPPGFKGTVIDLTTAGKGEPPVVPFQNGPLNDDPIDISDIPHLVARTREDEAYWESVEASVREHPPPDTEEEKEEEQEEEDKEEVVPHVAAEAQPPPNLEEIRGEDEGEKREQPAFLPEHSPLGGDVSIPEDERPETEEVNEVDVDLKAAYSEICKRLQIRPNSLFLSRLPSDPKAARDLDTLDLSMNYFGKGFAAALSLVHHLPRLRAVKANGMSLTNDDVHTLCAALIRHSAVQHVSLRDNPKVTLESSKPLFHLVRGNQRIVSIDVAGTNIGYDVATRLAIEAKANAKARGA